MQSNGLFYRMVTVKELFINAKSTCESHGGRLATFNNLEELNILLSFSGK